MGGIIVDDEIQVDPRRGLMIYLAQEFEEFLSTTAFVSVTVRSS
jgi:hypothetical protein